MLRTGNLTGGINVPSVEHDADGPISKQGATYPDGDFVGVGKLSVERVEAPLQELLSSPSPSVTKHAGLPGTQEVRPDSGHAPIS